MKRMLKIDYLNKIVYVLNTVYTTTWSVRMIALSD